MGLAEDEVDSLRLLDLDRGEFDFHSSQRVASQRLLVKPGARRLNAKPPSRQDATSGTAPPSCEWRAAGSLAASERTAPPGSGHGAGAQWRPAREWHGRWPHCGTR